MIASDPALQAPAFPDRQPASPRLEQVEADIQSLTGMIKEAAKTAPMEKRPLGAMMAKTGRARTVTVQGENGPSTGKAYRGGQTMQVHPEGPFAVELKAMGITPKTNPGLFSMRGRKDFDNLPASEMEEMFPGIFDATGSSRDDGAYLDQRGLLDLMGRENAGETDWLLPRAEVNRMERDLSQMQAVRDGIRDAKPDPAADFVAGFRTERGFFVDPDAPVIEPEALAREFDDWADEAGYYVDLDQRQEVLGELFQRGGDAEFLVSG